MNPAVDLYFKTQSLNIACFLFAKGFELVNIDTTVDPKRAMFVFVDTPDRELLLQQYSFAPEDSPTVICDVRKIFSSLRTLKEKLYQAKYE